MSYRVGLLENNELTTVYVLYPKDPLKLSEYLKNNYNKKELILELLKFGDIHVLNETPEKTVYYSRDKGDIKELCLPYKEKAKSLDDVNTNSSPVSYYFVWDGKWFGCEAYENNWLTVNKFINNLKK